MNYYSLNNPAAIVDFKEATIRGQAPDKGLYFPERIPRLPASFIDNINSYSKEEIAFRVIQPYVGDTLTEEELRRIVAETIVGLLAYDSQSYVSQNPRWTPSQAMNDKFGLRELIASALLS